MGNGGGHHTITIQSLNLFLFFREKGGGVGGCIQFRTKLKRNRQVEI